ncbi:MAG: type II toxin-antitoxin system VapC family toxin [Gemmatales bacterium]
MNNVLADTHSIIWYLSETNKLSTAARKSLEQAEQHGKILVSSITIVELIYLTERRRIDQAVLDELWNSISNSLEPIDVVPLTVRIALEMNYIPRSTVPDMPDRIIAATAFSTGLELVTADARIRALTNLKTVW